jgi:hypothetical protein
MIRLGVFSPDDPPSLAIEELPMDLMVAAELLHMFLHQGPGSIPFLLFNRLKDIAPISVGFIQVSVIYRQVFKGRGNEKVVYGFDDDVVKRISGHLPKIEVQLGFGLIELVT